MKRRFNWEKKYLYWGITAFLVIAACGLLFLIITNVPGIVNAFKALNRILSPFIWGLVLTYLLTPFMRLLDGKVFGPLFKRLFEKNKKGKDGSRLSRGLSVLFSEILLLLILTGIVYLVIPQLYNSLAEIVSESGTYVDTVTAWIEKMLSDYPEVEAYVMNALGGMQEGLISWLTGSVLPGLGSVVTSLAGGLFVVAKGLYNLVIGIIVSIYILSNLEGFGAKAKRLLYCVFSVKTADKICDGLEFTNRTFMGYITGTLLDSAIIGMLNYIFCAIVNIPYALLVTMLVAVSNIIPFFGPLIGIVPSALLIVLKSPVKCLIFVIFSLVLQQCDGNFIKPKILGQSIGINGFWVLFSIIVGNGLFGFWGMLLGVPVFYVIYTLIERAIVRKLKKRDLPYEPEEYRDIDRIDPVSGRVILKERVAAASNEARAAATEDAPAETETGDTDEISG